MMHAIGRPVAVRTAALFLASLLVAGCSGNAGGLIPAPFAGSGSAAGPDAGQPIPTFIRFRIPRRSRVRVRVLHPATISPLTESVSIAINGGKRTVFNTTPTATGCVATAAGTTCTFKVFAKAGTDTFVVTTYDAPSGTGTALDLGTLTVAIEKGKRNSVAISLGPVVTTAADSGMGSLRYAIGSADPGDTIMFLLQPGSTIALASAISLLGNDVTLAGPGASKLAISGGGTHQLFFNAGTLTISGLTLTGGNAASGGNPGGAIDNVTSLTLVNDVIGSNTSAAALRRRSAPIFAGFLRPHHLHPHCSPTSAKGGAIYNTGTLVMSGTTFNGNVVASDAATCVSGLGGAIYNDVNGSLSSTNDTYSANSAQAGGGVFNAGNGQVTFTNDTFTGNTGCNAQSGCTTAYVGEGSAIADDGNGIVVTNSTFTNNVAGGLAPGASTGIGGALLLGGGAPLVTGSTFTNNLAGGGAGSCSESEGGAIAAAVPIELDNDTFTNNQAIGDKVATGGAVMGISASAIISGTGDKFDSNSVSGSGSSCSPNGEGVAGAVGSQTAATFTNTTFSRNTATSNASAAGAALVCGTCVVSNDAFSNNTALATGAGAAAGATAGGTVYAMTLVKASNCTFTSNAVTAESAVAQIAFGAAIVSAKSMALSGNTFTSNSATLVSGSGGSGATGGAISDNQTSGSVVSSGDTFTSNTATSPETTYGGAAYIVGPYSFTNDTFSNNTATGKQGGGGGLALGVHPGTLSTDTFNANTASATVGGNMGGGGIYDNGGATIDGAKVTNNTASTAGGGILTLGSNAEGLIGDAVTGNKVTNASLSLMGGGGIFNDSAILMLNSTVANNSVSVTGSGYGGGGLLDVAGLLVIGSTISGNVVLGTSSFGGGGGILSGSGLDAENSTITGNRSSMDGGGVLVGSNTGTSFTNVTFYQNSALGYGGNLDNQQTMTLTNSIVAGGTSGHGAAGGPDVYTTGTITSDDWNIVQTTVIGAFTPAADDLQLTDPLLLPLSNNGGPSFTNADRATSPGTARIPFAGGVCGNGGLNTDQRGYTRGVAIVAGQTMCDVGAYEHAGVASAARMHLPKVHLRRSTVRLPFVQPHFKPFQITLPT